MRQLISVSNLCVLSVFLLACAGKSRRDVHRLRRDAGKGA